VNLSRIFVAMALLASRLLAQQPAAPAQPIPFSHKVHAGTLKLQCKMCHPNPDPGETMTIAAASKCMQCHTAIKADSPSIQKLAAFAKNGREMPWARVYQIPDFVHFSHRTHLNSGAQCTDCHGQVAQRDQLFREVNLSMGDCMTCHRAKNASIDCLYCHEQQQ
jgi:Cytochrome c7 and related cytochrome c/Class III cytochrome C family